MLIPNLTRGKQTIFEETLPESPDTVVTLSVYDSNGSLITSGPASLVSGTDFQFEFTVPTNAAYGGWLVDWTYTYNTGVSNRSIRRGFAVVDITGQSEYKQSNIIVAGQKEFVELFVPSQVTDLKATMQRIGSLEGVKYPTAPVLFTGTIANGMIEEAQLDDGTFRYRFSTPAAGLGGGEYLVMWSYRDTPSSPVQRITSIAWSAPAFAWSLITQLRQYVDKIQKQTGIIQAYNDAELMNNLAKGIQFVNRVVPISEWTYATLPWQTFELYVIEGAALWTLRTQYLLEGDLQFSYSGQTITLDYDHLGFLSEEIGRLEDDLHNPEKLGKTKLDFAQRTGVSVAVGVRTRRTEIIRWQ